MYKVTSCSLRVVFSETDQSLGSGSHLLWYRDRLDNVVASKLFLHIFPSYT